MKVVGLVGRKRSGKDTVADVFEKLGWYRTSFAKALYKEVSEAFKVEVSKLQGHETKEVAWLKLEDCQDLEFLELAKALARVSVLDKGDSLGIESEDLVNFKLSPRRILQWWGTEYRRKDDTFYWVRKLSEELAARKPKHVIISDIREPHEAAYVKRTDGYLIAVIRPELVDDATSSHSSEKNLEHIGVDGKLFNTSSIEHLRADVEVMEQSLK